jgi:hypothetical protein
MKALAAKSRCPVAIMNLAGRLVSIGDLRCMTPDIHKESGPEGMNSVAGAMGGREQ